jgi:hypothetical protein
MNYIAKAEVIQAFQLTREMVANPSLVPEWAAQYVSQPCSQGVAGVLLTKPMVHGSRKVRALYAGEWLAKNSAGELWIMTDDVFKKGFVECQDI